MYKQVFSLLAVAALGVFSSSPAQAQAAYRSQGHHGTFGRTSQSTNNFRRTNSRFTSNMRSAIAPTTRRRLASVHGPSGRNGLPPTRLDSFVRQAGAEAAHIYGDEGYTIPPYLEFTKIHRINNGITGDRDAGLTTGHGSYMADAWGGDEYVDGPEFSQSGANHGNPRHLSQGVYLGADPNPPQYVPVRSAVNHSGGGQQPAELPYTPGSNWATITNTHTGDIMGYMAPGETWQDFYSGASGHLLPGWEAEGQYILQNQIRNPQGSPWTGGF